MKKAAHILRMHGPATLAVRVFAKSARLLSEWKRARRGRRAWRRNLRFARAVPVDVRECSAPVVSFVVAAQRGVPAVSACLQAIRAHASRVPHEVIVVVDEGDVELRCFVSRCSGVHAVTADGAAGFSARVRGAVAAARGEFVYVSVDTLPTPGWLEPLLDQLRSDERIAVAGPQQRDGAGRLFEAGTVVLAGGTVRSFGHGEDPADPRYQFVRSGACLSAHALLVRRAPLLAAGGFGDGFTSPAYAGADLCSTLRSAGLDVVYQPRSLVARLAGERAASRDRELFAERWSAARLAVLGTDTSSVQTSARRRTAGTVLVIDGFVPFHDRDAGSRRLLAILQLMRELGRHVIFLPEDGGAYEPYTTNLRQLGIEVLTHAGSARRMLAELPVEIDVAWLCRAEFCGRHLQAVRERLGAAVVYDTVDLHHVRFARARAYGRSEADPEATRTIELGLARAADHTVVTSEGDRDVLREAGLDATVVPIVETPLAEGPGRAGRRGAIFVGNYTHAPNVDGVTWLCTEILPLVWAQRPDFEAVLAGVEPPSAVRRLGGSRVRVAGYVPDVGPLLDRAVMSVAPLRFGAGMKGKVVESLAHGVPCVATPIAAEGIGLTDGIDVSIAADPAAFAAAMLRLLDDAPHWERIAAGARAAARRYSPIAVKPAVRRALDLATASGAASPAHVRRA